MREPGLLGGNAPPCGALCVPSSSASQAGASADMAADMSLSCRAPVARYHTPACQAIAYAAVCHILCIRRVDAFSVTELMCGMHSVLVLHSQRAWAKDGRRTLTDT